MFTCSERHTVSRILAVATVAAWLLLPGMGQTSAFGANEKGPRCSDGIDINWCCLHPLYFSQFSHPD